MKTYLVNQYVVIGIYGESRQDKKTDGEDKLWSEKLETEVDHNHIQCQRETYLSASIILRGKRERIPSDILT